MKSRSHDRARPDADDLEKGSYYCSRIGHELDFAGEISDESAAIRWRFGTQPKRSPFSMMNLLKNPDFIVMDSNEREVLRVRQESRFPPRFQMIEDNQVVGKIEMRSLLRNKYTIDFKGEAKWTVHMPLFSVRFLGQANEDSHVWIMMGPKRQWNFLIEKGADSVQLLAGLAFIHRQWWCYS